LHLYIHTYIQIQSDIDTYIRIHTLTNTCIYLYIHAYILRCTNENMHIYIHTNKHTHTVIHNNDTYNRTNSDKLMKIIPHKHMHTITHTCIELAYANESMHIYIHTYILT